jgi:hypothetical protein
VGELKGIRAYHEALRRLGIQNPGEVGFQTPIEFVAQVDNLEHLQPPIPVPVVYFNGLVAAGGAGTHVGFEVEARGRGVWIEQIREGGLGLANVIFPGVARTVLAPIAIGATSHAGPDPVSVMSAISILTANIPTATWQNTPAETHVVPSVFLAPGQRCQVINSNPNAIFLGGIGFREVPARGPDPES